VRKVPLRFGVDANGGIDIQRAKLAGVSFVGRYHSDDGYDRNLTPEEAKAWAATRTDIVSCWENGRSEEVREGYTAGVRCAWAAKQQQAACGGAGQPIFFAVDFVTRYATIGPVRKFFAGAASVLGKGRLGAYGTHLTIERLFDLNLIRYGWQTSLFSDEPWDPRAQLRQVSNTDLTGSDDFGAPGYLAYDLALAHDFGQWRPT
jgi:hypothetical protein